MRYYFSNSDLYYQFGLRKSFMDDIVKRGYVLPGKHSLSPKRMFNTYESMIVWLIHQLKEQAGYPTPQANRLSRLMLATLMWQLYHIQVSGETNSWIYGICLVNYNIGYLTAAKGEMSNYESIPFPEWQPIFFTRAKDMKIPKETVIDLKQEAFSLQELKLTQVIDEGLSRLGVLPYERVPFTLDENVTFYRVKELPYVLAALTTEKINNNLNVEIEKLPVDAEVEYVRN